jgi:8-oxo-dGTP diphosphatase
MKKVYVIVFLFGLGRDTLLLIRKNRPDWQAGKLNGLGGKVEKDETLCEAVIREVKEECGVQLRNYELEFIERIPRDEKPKGCKNHEIIVFAAVANLSQWSKTTDEEPVLIDIKELFTRNHDFVHNVSRLASKSLCLI